jgi:hypothetical protein
LKDGDRVLVECESFHGINESLTEISSFNNEPNRKDYGKDYRIKFDSSNKIRLFTPTEDKSELYQFYEWYSEANAASRADVLNELRKRLNLPIEQYPKL